MCAIEKGSGPVQLLTSIERKSVDVWKAPHVSCWAGGCCNIVVRFSGFVCFKSLLCSLEDYKTVPWAQMWGRPPPKERNAATNAMHREAPPFAGALVILCTPCSFCFAWGGVKKRQQKVLFSYIFTSTPFDSSPQPEKMRKDPVFTCSNCTCFTASSLQKTNKTTTKKRKTGGKMSTGNTEHGGSLCTSWTRWCISCKSHNLGWLHQVQAVVLSGLASLASASVALQRYRT